MRFIIKMGSYLSKRQMTWFVQMMMNELYAMTLEYGCCRTDMMEEARKKIFSRKRAAIKTCLPTFPKTEDRTTGHCQGGERPKRHLSKVYKEIQPQ